LSCRAPKQAKTSALLGFDLRAMLFLVLWHTVGVGCMRFCRFGANSFFPIIVIFSVFVLLKYFIG
jgi:hypothetical protein